jgi:general secretion pathway protein B
MSYILEALKKADADRERSRVPDLHAQPDPPADRDRLRSRRGRWIGAALLALLAAGVVGWALRLAPVPTEAMATAPSTPTPTPTPPPQERLALPAAQTPAVIAVQIAPPVAPRPIVEEVKPAGTAIVAPTASAPASTAALRLPTLAELPAEIRSQLPALNVGGSMYSTSAAVRMVILSGQVFREGDSPAAGLTIVQIGPKSTVLAFRGQRFELKH